MTVAVIGAGLAGLRTCEALRQHGYADPIVLIGAEPDLPYSRPPLSKEVLRAESDPSVATLRSAAELAALGLELRLGVAAVSLDVAGREVGLADGSAVGFDDVVIATGAAPRSLPGVEAVNVHPLRTVGDSLALRDRLVPGARLVVVGAGFIGLEVAASARSLGCDVTVFDVLPAPLARVLPAGVGAAVRRLHEDHGVAFRTAIGVTGIDSCEGVARAVLLDDGTSVPADAVVVGIGVAPSTGWLAGSGLAVDDGVGCDQTLQAAPGAWVVGDVARWRLPSGVTTRVEHWTNATEQPQTVARSIVSGTPVAFDSVPYFWSDQYAAKLQSLGFVGPTDEMQVVFGALDEPKWTALLHDGDRLTGVVGMSTAGRVMKARALLASGASYADALAAYAG